jgi:D-cysteine desulfhydrase
LPEPTDRLHPDLALRFPGLARRLPWLGLGAWPTPVQRLERLGRRLGAEVWIKRDDLSHPRYGGNKVRKLEPLLAEARRRGCPSVLTMGGVGSNHVVATAVHAAALGLKTRAVVFPQPVTAEVRKSLELALALGVRLFPCPTRLLVPAQVARVRRRGRDYVIGPGGSSPQGTLGHVAAGLELGRQVAQGLLPPPDDIFIALGSGGSTAGLVLGLGLAGLQVRLVAVRVVERVLCNRVLVDLLLRRTAALMRRLGADPGHRRAELVLDHGQAGRAYGAPTAAGARAIRLLQDSEGITLEPTYTAKALAGLLVHCAGPGRGRRALFWHTYNGRDTRPLLEGGAGPPAPPATIARWLQRGRVD